MSISEFHLQVDPGVGVNCENNYWFLQKLLSEQGKTATQISYETALGITNRTIVFEDLPKPVQGLVLKYNPWALGLG